MVTADPEEAQAALARGVRVVLVLAAERLPAPVSAVPGRLAVLVGDPDDPGVWAAAAAMERELYYEAGR